MAVAFDAKATAVTIQSAGPTSPIENSTLTVGSSGTLVIGVFLAANGTTNQAVPSAMTWNSVAMTPVGNITDSNGDAAIYIYAIVHPVTGNKTCSCTYTVNDSTTVDLDCFSFSGTDISS